MRQTLLAGAAALFDAGEADFSVHALAARVECSVGTIYRHFSSKDALVAAVRADQLLALTQRLWDADAGWSAGSTEHAPLARVAARAHDLYCAARDDPRLLRTALASLTSPHEPDHGVVRAALAITSALSGSLTDASEDTASAEQLDQVGAALGITLVALALTSDVGRLDPGVTETLAVRTVVACLRSIDADPEAAQRAALGAWPTPPPSAGP